jgi:hypothetical protein
MAQITRSYGIRKDFSTGRIKGRIDKSIKKRQKSLKFTKLDEKNMRNLRKCIFIQI